MKEWTSLTPTTALMAVNFAIAAQEEKDSGSTDLMWDYYIAMGKAAEEYLKEIANETMG